MSSTSLLLGHHVSLDNDDPTTLGIIVDGPHYQGTGTPGEGQYYYTVAVYTNETSPISPVKLVSIKLEDIVLSGCITSLSTKYGLQQLR